MLSGLPNPTDSSRCAALRRGMEAYACSRPELRLVSTTMAGYDADGGAGVPRLGAPSGTSSASARQDAHASFDNRLGRGSWSWRGGRQRGRGRGALASVGWSRRSGSGSEWGDHEAVDAWETAKLAAHEL